MLWFFSAVRAECLSGRYLPGSLIARTLFVQSLTRRGTARQGSRKFSSFCPHFSLDFSLHFQRECFAIVMSDLGVYSLRQESDYRRQQQLLAESGPAEASLGNSVTSLQSAESPPPTVAGPVARTIGGSTGCRSIFPSHPVQPPC